MPVYEERIWLHADKRLCFLQNNSDAPKTLVAPHWHEGYCSASSFIRAFERAYGMTPHAYRRTHFPLTGHTAE